MNRRFSIPEHLDQDQDPDQSHNHKKNIQSYDGAKLNSHLSLKQFTNVLNSHQKNNVKTYRLPQIPKKESMQDMVIIEEIQDQEITKSDKNNKFSSFSQCKDIYQSNSKILGKKSKSKNKDKTPPKSQMQEKSRKLGHSKLEVENTVRFVMVEKSVSSKSEHNDFSIDLDFSSSPQKPDHPLGISQKTLKNLSKMQQEKSEQQKHANQINRARAKKERELANVKNYQNERDMLRDWIKKAAPSTYSDQQIMLTPYKHHEEVINDQIIFQSNGRDTYFKRAALRKKSEGIWVENPISSSYFYTVKWDYGDTNLHYERMKPHQFVNHFPDTRELTTKQGLTKNLNNCTEVGVDVSSFFPRSYDLSDRREVDLWIADFNQTAILNLLQKHAEFFEQIMQKQPEDWKSQNQLNENYSLQKKLQLKERLCREKCPKQICNDGFVNVAMLEAALFYCQNLINNASELNPGDEYFKKSCYKPDYRIPNQLTEMLMAYSEWELPIFKENGAFNVRFKRLKQSTWCSIDNLNVYIMLITIRQSKLLEKYVPQYGNNSVNGTQNVWICKPSYNARGLGIFCFNQKNDIISTFSKKAPAPKVVQKYIERPLLLKDLTHKGDDRKFDIRQWVLLTSVDPLQVYIYQDAYLRICGQKYDIEQFDDPIRHLSNYSIQKHEADEDKEFVMSSQEFIQRLGRDGVTWQNTFYQQIRDITIKVFNRMSEVFDQRANSFELFGLDFVIDQNLKCWLIEANMSPACAHRKGQQWLTDMADDMSDGMVNIIEHKILKNMASQKISFEGPIVEKINNLQKPDLKNWENIINEKDELEKKHITRAQLQLEKPLEIIGNKANLKIEKKMDKRYRKYVAVLFIQRFYRGYLARKKLSRGNFFIEFAKVFANIIPEQEDKKKESFQKIKEYFWIKNAEKDLQKVIQIQNYYKLRLSSLPGTPRDYIQIAEPTTSTRDSIQPSKNVKKTRRKVGRRQRMAYEQQNLDPNLLMNPAGLGITMLIPASGNFFQLSGGITIKRQNPENPIEILERLEERERQKRLYELQMEAMRIQAKEKGSLIDPTMDRDKTIFDIYTRTKPNNMFAGTFFGNRQATNGFAKSGFKARDISFDQKPWKDRNTQTLSLFQQSGHKNPKKLLHGFSPYEKERQTFRVTRHGSDKFESPYQQQFKKTFASKGSIFNQQVMVQSGPVNTTFEQLEDNSRNDRNMIIISDSVENIVPKKGKSAVSQTRKAKLNIGLLTQINTDKGKNFVVSANSSKIKLDQREKSMIEMYTQYRNLKPNKKK